MKTRTAADTVVTIKACLFNNTEKPASVVLNYFTFILTALAWISFVRS